MPACALKAQLRLLLRLVAQEAQPAIAGSFAHGRSRGNVGFGLLAGKILGEGGVGLTAVSSKFRCPTIDNLSVVSNSAKSAQMGTHIRERQGVAVGSL